MHAPASSHHHDHASRQDRGSARRITVYGALANVCLAVGKLVVGIVGQSYALVADAIHSLSDIASDIIVLFALRIGGQGPDANHPYGHARFETLATVALGFSLIALGGLIAVDATQRVATSAEITQPGLLALAAAMVSLLVKEVLYQATIRVARRDGSSLLMANAWHHRSDALSSLVALAGIAGAVVGFPILDVVAAGVIAVMLAKIGWDCAWPSLKELTDVGLPQKELKTLERLVSSVPDVRGVSAMRTRHFGRYVLADVEIKVDPRFSVSEGHRIAEGVRVALESEIPEINGVTVHVEPDERTSHAALADLPERAELEAAIRAALEGLPGAERIESITLHYIDNGVDAEVVLPIAAADSVEELEGIKERYAATAKKIANLRRLEVKFR